MAAIVFVPLPETGHINATFKFAKSLEARGHEVYQLGLADFADYVSAQGFRYISVFEDLYPRGLIAQRASRPSALRNFNIFQELLLNSAAANPAMSPEQVIGTEIQRVIEKIPVDLFLIDGLLPEFAVILQRMGVPGLLLHTVLFDNMEENEPLFAPLFGQPELILCPREFDFPGREKAPRRFYYLEAAVDLQRQERPFDWQRVDERRPLLYCSLGSQCHLYPESKPFFQVMIDAMKAAPQWQMVLSIGPHLRAEDFTGIPDNIILVNSAPQLEILKRASLMITHGGINSIKECIFLGVPMIVFPVSSDQPMNAARIEYHGLGIRGRLNKLSVELVHSLINKVTSDHSYKARSEAMQKKFLEVEASGIGATVVERILKELAQRKGLADPLKAISQRT